MIFDHHALSFFGLAINFQAAGGSLRNPPAAVLT
jgi:hypothetical protein